MKRNKKERNLVYLFLSLMLLFLSIPTAHLISVLWYSLQLIPLEPFGFKCPKGKIDQKHDEIIQIVSFCFLLSSWKTRTHFIVYNVMNDEWNEERMNKAKIFFNGLISYSSWHLFNGIKKKGMEEK